jgi:hypothetical protein
VQRLLRALLRIGKGGMCHQLAEDLRSRRAASAGRFKHHRHERDSITRTLASGVAEVSFHRLVITSGNQSLASSASLNVDPVGGTNRKVKRRWRTLRPGVKVNICRATKILTGVLDVRDEEVQRLGLSGKPSAVTQMGEEVAQDIVPPRAVAATGAQQRVIPFAIHNSTAEGTVAATKAHVSPDTPL